MGKKPVGGRGHKNLYESTHVRVPEPIKPLVDSLANEYRKFVSECRTLDFDSRGLLPAVPAIYFVLEDEEIVYIGQSKNLQSRWRKHNLIQRFKELPGSVSIAWLQCENPKLLRAIESTLIEAIQPKFNISIRGETSTSFKPTWNLGKTRLIRVPEAVADDLLAYAKKLDEGKSRAPYVSAILERFVEYQRSKYGKNNAQKSEFSTDGSRWYYLKEFRKWIEND